MDDSPPPAQVQVNVPAAPAYSRLRRSFMPTTRDSSTVDFFPCQRYQLPLPVPPIPAPPPWILPKTIVLRAIDTLGIKTLGIKRFEEPLVALRCPPAILNSLPPGGDFRFGGSRRLGRRLFRRQDGQQPRFQPQ